MTLARMLGYMVLAWSASASQAPERRLEACPASDARLCQDAERGRRIKALEARSADELSRLALFGERRRYTDALRVLSGIIDTAPARMPAALDAFTPYLTSATIDLASGNHEMLAEILERARRKLPAVSEGARADVALQLLRLERGARITARDDWRPRLSHLIDEFNGTPAAASARVQLIAATEDIDARLDALEQFALQHPESVAGAQALFAAGSWLAHNSRSSQGRVERDPMPRFLRVREIAARLQSGDWPDSEWVRRAPELLTGFSWHGAEFSNESLDRLIGFYRDLVAASFAASSGAALPTDRIAFVIQIKLRDLYQRKGVPLSDMDSLLDEWARLAAEPDAVRYLQGVTWERWSSDPDVPGPWRDKARGAFASVAASDGQYSRLALASLASLHFRDRAFAAAADIYVRYLARFPRSSYAWVAALRLGQAYEESGDWAAAAAAYDRAAADYAEEPIARVLGGANAARAREALDDPQAALAAYRLALHAWDDDYRAGGQAYVLHTNFNEPWPGRVIKSAEPVTQAALAADVARLEHALATPGGLLLEQGRSRLEEGRWLDAETALGAFIARQPAFDALPEARYLRHLAQLNRALDLADVEGAAPDASSARRILDAITSDPWDPAVGLAKIASASLLLASEPDGARRALRAALEEWRRFQNPPPGVTPLEGLAEEVAEIRKVVFRPAGGDPYTRERRWEAFPPATSRPFLVVDPVLTVGLADGTERAVAVFRATADVDDVLFLNDEHRELLARIAEKLGGTRTRQPGAVMEVPNQPVGGARAIVSLWNEFFEAQPGHWHGWMFETAPIVTRIDFLNAERTRAAVKVTMRYEGVTVVLERTGMAWKVVRLTNRWIT